MKKYKGKENKSLNAYEDRISNPKKLSFVHRASNDKITPLDFDGFVPWLCLQWSCPQNVVVTRMSQEEYIKVENRRPSSSRNKSLKSLKFKRDDVEIDIKNSATTVAKTLATKTTASKASDNDTVSVKAYYDSRSYLVEISILGCPIKIHRKLIQAFNLCLPFHSLLTRLTIRRGGLSFYLIYEISKLLPHSNLTDVCLDDSFITEANYYVLLEHKSQLRYLSLNRCSINDYVCKEIATRINYGLPGSTLLILELGGNLITDLGAQSLGDMLRRNRKLLHINLSGNNISDTGALAILKHLSEFPLSDDEVLATKRQKVKYMEHRAEVYKKCLIDVAIRQREEMQAATASSLTSRKSIISKCSKSKKSKRNLSIVVEQVSNADLAEIMTKGIVGDFSDPYNDDNVIKKDDYYYAIGNMALSSLNLAYNNLGYLSVKRIADVLKYQSVIAKPVDATGLVRIVIHGNTIPDWCIEYDIIDMMLKKLVIENDSSAPATVIKRQATTMSLKKPKRSV